MKANHKKILLAQCLANLPEMLRDSLLSDVDIVSKYDLDTKFQVTLGGSDTSFESEVFYKAIRETANGSGNAQIEDSNGRFWNVQVEHLEGGKHIFSLSNAQNRLRLPDFSFFSESKAMRVEALDSISKDLYLPANSVEYWKELAVERSLEVKEIDGFHKEIADSVIRVAQNIKRILGSEEIASSSLVPLSRRYYQRLVGEYDGSSTIEEYARCRGIEVFREYLKWSREKGFGYCLHMLVHPAFVKHIEFDDLETLDFEATYIYLEEHGSPFEKIVGIELGMRIIQQRPDLEPKLLKLIDAICDQSSLNTFFMFSSIFVLVDAEISKNKIFEKEPPFYRRLASLAHTGVIFRELMKIDLGDGFAVWARKTGAGQYLMQTFADMRSEPRWHPDFISTTNLRSYLLVRILNSLPEEILESKTGAIYEKTLGHGAGSVMNTLDLGLFLHLGPLDGADSSAIELPKEFSDAIENQLKEESRDGPKPITFTALVNSARIYGLKPEHAEMAAKILREGKYRLSKIEDRSHLITVLNGLASVAAVTRCKELADELRILDRKYRRDQQFQLSVNESMLLCLASSSSRSELIDWCDFVGQWITELSFFELSGDDAKLLYVNLRLLLHSVPELWLHCSEAEAAIRACMEEPMNIPLNSV
ncbi:hypothetical protein [Cerasicoccus fimbriatus]|uniref:hypothetical protein n=1 Tax=Cerasicoccus fimbriatus TaxID=3014554 RepID=UPI0022B32535|nr:hypothetical protein [Cerasicoccus sp. TK19100]